MPSKADDLSIYVLQLKQTFLFILYLF